MTIAIKKKTAALIGTSGFPVPRMVAARLEETIC